MHSPRLPPPCLPPVARHTESEIVLFQFNFRCRCLFRLPSDLNVHAAGASTTLIERRKARETVIKNQPTGQLQ